MNKYLEKYNLRKKTAFIVGGRGLIGKEVSNAISSCGAKTIIIDNNKKTNFKNFNQIFENLDLSNLKSIENKYNNLKKKYGTPDIFVNCSYPKTKDWNNNSFRKISLSSLRKNIDIHLNSCLWISRLVSEDMALNKVHGSIINMGSIYGVVSQDMNIYKNTKMNESLAYSAIKGGIINNARLMASYYGKKGIRVNCISLAGVYNKHDKKFVEQLSYRIPLGRMAQPDEFNGAIIYLCSNASSFVTGHNLVIDGGRTVW